MMFLGIDQYLIVMHEYLFDAPWVYITIVAVFFGFFQRTGIGGLFRLIFDKFEAETEYYTQIELDILKYFVLEGNQSKK